MPGIPTWTQPIAAAARDWEGANGAAVRSIVFNPVTESLSCVCRDLSGKWCGTAVFYEYDDPAVIPRRLDMVTVPKWL